METTKSSDYVLIHGGCRKPYLNVQLFQLLNLRPVSPTSLSDRLMNLHKPTVDLQNLLFCMITGKSRRVNSAFMTEGHDLIVWSRGYS